MVRELRRIGKRIAIGLDNDLWLVLHLMIAGRLHWRRRERSCAGRNDLAAFDFPTGSLMLTEAGTKRRASLHVLAGEEGWLASIRAASMFSPADLASFAAALTAENRTLKRALTDPRILERHRQCVFGRDPARGAAFADCADAQAEPKEWERLFAATRDAAACGPRSCARRRSEFPEKVTAFRKDMAVHGRYGEPVRGAARRFSASGMPTTRPITARDARRAGKCWRIGSVATVGVGLAADAGGIGGAEAK